MLITAGEDFDADLALPNIDFGVYVSSIHRYLHTPKLTALFSTAHLSTILVRLALPNSRAHIQRAHISEIGTHLGTIPAPTSPLQTGASNGSSNTPKVPRTLLLSIWELWTNESLILPAAKKANKPVVLEEFGYFGLSTPSSIVKLSPRTKGLMITTDLLFSKTIRHRCSLAGLGLLCRRSKSKALQLLLSIFANNNLS